MLCPYCNEEIKDGAKKCRFCGEFLDGSKQQAQVQQQSQPQVIVKQDNFSELSYDSEMNIHCPNCKYEGKAQKKCRGSGRIELALRILIFPFGGLIYSLRRRSDCKCKCPKCGNSFLGMGITENGVKKANSKKNSTSRIWIVCGIMLFIAICSTANRTETRVNEIKAEQTSSHDQAVEGRLSRLRELYAEDPTFDKVEMIDTNIMGMYFNSKPDEENVGSIDLITRGQASNLSKEINGVASVKTFIGGVAQMFCTATKGQVNSCEDYR